MQVCSEDVLIVISKFVQELIHHRVWLLLEV